MNPPATIAIYRRALAALYRRRKLLVDKPELSDEERAQLERIIILIQQREQAIAAEELAYARALITTGDLEAVIAEFDRLPDTDLQRAVDTAAHTLLVDSAIQYGLVTMDAPWEANRERCFAALEAGRRRNLHPALDHPTSEEP